MEYDFYAQVESRLDDLNTRLKAAEQALLQIPQINMEQDVSRPQVILVDPAALIPGA